MKRDGEGCEDLGGRGRGRYWVLELQPGDNFPKRKVEENGTGAPSEDAEESFELKADQIYFLMLLAYKASNVPLESSLWNRYT